VIESVDDMARTGAFATVCLMTGRTAEARPIRLAKDIILLDRQLYNFSRVEDFAATDRLTVLVGMKKYMLWNMKLHLFAKE
jgi:hypothetical protein